LRQNIRNHPIGHAADRLRQTGPKPQGISKNWRKID